MNKDVAIGLLIVATVCCTDGLKGGLLASTVLLDETEWGRLDPYAKSLSEKIKKRFEEEG